MTLRDVDSIPFPTSSSLPASSKDLCDLPNLLPGARLKMQGVTCRQEDAELRLKMQGVTCRQEDAELSMSS